jgi:hypothetical protein
MTIATFFPGWDSVESAARWHRGFEIAGFIALGLLLLFEVLAYIYGNRKDTLISASNAKIEQQRQQQDEAANKARDVQIRAAQQLAATAKERLQVAERADDLTLLVTRMNADDARAYDSLRVFKGTPAQDATVKAALEAVVQAHRSPYTQHHPQWKHNLLLQEVDNILSSEVSRPYDTLSALEVLMASPIQKKLFPKVVSMALSAPSLDVRTAATQVLNNWTGSSNFRPLDKDQLTFWWETSGKKD